MFFNCLRSSRDRIKFFTFLHKFTIITPFCYLFGINTLHYQYICFTLGFNSTPIRHQALYLLTVEN